VVSLGVLSVLAATASFLHAFLSVMVSVRTVTRLRQEAFHHVISMPLMRVVERGPSEFVTRIVRDAAELQSGFMALTSKSVAHATRGIACLVAAMVVSLEVALVAPAAGLVLAVLLRKLGKRIRRGTRGALQANERLLRITTESVQGLRSVKASTAEPYALRRFARDNRLALREEMRVRTARAVASPLVETLALLIVGALAIIFAGRIIRGGMPFERFVAALGALGVAGGSFKPLAGIVNQLQACGPPATRLRDLLDEPLEQRRGPGRIILPRHRRDIVVEAATVRYPAADRPALDDVSLRVEHGQRVALVGPNGSGKTTLVGLLPRLVRPSAGRVLVDGVDVEAVNLRGLRRQIGVVAQETVLFRGSVRENIALGWPGAGDEEVEAAARRAHAHEFIAVLPNGYETDLAEQGASLSGGQRQRLAIARAILRDPSILILDEATSSLDPESEDLIARTLSEFCRDRTALVVAHRMRTVLDADRIVVMDGGRIIDQGAHDDLATRCELYARLVGVTA
ncbi:MAG: ABC transporter ATP-binding protein, partial [Planctomycetota bacterium]